jgi:hypothetical protein
MPKFNLFPLYLTPIERFFCLDDRPSHPMAFLSVWEFSGVIDRPAFEGALADAIARHPLLHAFVRPAKRGQPCWVDSKGALPQVVWGDLARPITADRGERIDLAGEVGLRIWVQQGENRAKVTFQFHHACTDGIGASRFIGDLLAFYALRMPNGDEPPRLEPLDVERLRDRLNLQVEYWPTKRYVAMAKRGLGTLAGLLWRRPYPLGSSAAGPPSAPPFPGVHNASLGRDEFEALRTFALERSASLNDLLVAALFGTLRKWTQARGGRAARRPLRIMMPTDLRDGESLTLPATCLASYSFLTRDQAECGDEFRLLESVRNETTDIKNSRRGVHFSDSLAFAISSGVLKSIVQAPICLATAVLSNIGDPTRRFAARLPRRGGRIVAGNLVLEDVTGVPPLRPNTRAIFCVYSYGRKLTVSLRCDASFLSEKDTAGLLDLYIRQLQSYLPAPGAVAAT